MKNCYRSVFMLFVALGGSLCAWANGSTPVSGRGVGDAISANQMQSAATFRVGQTDCVVTSVVTILAILPGQGHTLVGQTVHTLNFGGGDTITTADSGHLVPVDNAGLYQLLLKGQVTGGTGRFAGATGDLTFTGRVNLATGHVEWQVHGQLK